MEVVVKAKNLTLTEPLRQYVQRKIGRLERHLPQATEARVELIQETTKGAAASHRVQVTLNSAGTMLRAEERAADLLAAVDAAATVLDRQIERWKGRLYLRGRRRTARLTIPELEARPGTPSPGGRVVKIKRFAIKPMSPEEAITQMELLGHSFFLFLNAETEEFNVLYRRRDGDYGLIGPESR